MYAVATFLVVAVITLTFTQIAAGALIATGMPREIAAFQARSAFSGAGFTTTEAENVVNHPTRRRIIATTMFVGALGTPTLVVTVLLGFLAPGPGSTTERTLVTVAGVMFIFLVLANRPMQSLLERVGRRAATSRLVPQLDEGFDELVDLGSSFVIGEITLREQPGATYRSLEGLDEGLRGIDVLGVRQGDVYIGGSPADLELRAGDVIVVHGRRDLVERHSA